jgi:hypothetical protein
MSDETRTAPVGMAAGRNPDAFCPEAGAYRSFFFSNERGERPHIHVQRDRCLAKFWLDPVELVASRGYASSELRRLARLVVEYGEELQEAWPEFFSI